MMAIVGSLRPAPATDIVAVGSKTTLITHYFSSGVMSGTVSCTLPSGCAPGDTVVLSAAAANGAYDLQWGAPSGAATILPSTTYSIAKLAVFLVALTTTDITAGVVSLPWTRSVDTGTGISALVSADVYRGAVELDITGTATTPTKPGTSDFGVTVPSITPSVGDVMLQSVMFSDLNGGAMSVSVPPDWTPGDNVTAAWGAYVATLHRLQASAGATGTVTVTVSSPTAGPKFYGFMFALRRADPTFRMTGLLSATGTVGTAYSSTLTLAGDFTGPVTISGLPAWLSGTVSGNTVTISGTPTTADTYDFTPVATDSASQAATGSAQSIVVAAASADPVLVQQQVSLGSASGSTLSLTLASAPVAGNTLVLYKAQSDTNTPSSIPGWTTVSTTFSGATTGRRAIYKRTADGTEGTTITIATSPGNFGFAVQEWQGSMDVTAAEAGNAAAGTGTFSVGTLSAPATKSVPAIFTMFNGASPTSAASWPAGWTSVGPLPNGSFPNRGQCMAYGTATTGATSAVSPTYTGTRGNGVVVLWVGAWIA
ncbi:hypothetical protein RLIN73S_00981 [Rhodanobacter lindaniclasticus]